MSKQPPVTIFSSTIDPEGVLEVLRAAGATVKVNSPWTTGTATFGGGLFRAGKQMTLEHDAGYYSDESFSKQLPGMFQYYLRAAPPIELLELVRSFRFAVSFVPGSFEDDDPRWQAVQAMCAHLDGAIHVNGAMLDAQARLLFAPNGQRDPSATWPTSAEPNPILSRRGALYEGEASEQRQRSVQALTDAGYAAAVRLPSSPDAALRPVEQVIRRLAALQGLVSYVTAPAEPADQAKDFLERLGLHAELTPRERELAQLPREEATAHMGSIGWRMENMWPLAWALGFDAEPDLKPGMISGETTRAMWEFLPSLSADLSEFQERITPRTLDDVAQLEDTFYLAHHAVRSAQQGLTTTPAGFHPASDGGVIHERRHALSWLVSPSDAWDEVSLST